MALPFFMQFHILYVSFRSKKHRYVGGRRGISPPRSHRSVRDSLPSYGSYYPAAGKTIGLASLAGSSHFWLTNKFSRTMQPLRSSLITKPSSLLRATPPLCPASVLSLSWGLHLSFSLNIRTTGSHVPHKSLDQVHATFMPSTAQAVNRSPLDLSRSIASPRF